MKQVTINSGVVLAMLAAVVALVGALVAAQLPELKRYMKIRSM